MQYDSLYKTEYVVKFYAKCYTEHNLVWKIQQAEQFRTKYRGFKKTYFGEQSIPPTPLDHASMTSLYFDPQLPSIWITPHPHSGL